MVCRSLCMLCPVTVRYAGGRKKGKEFSNVRKLHTNEPGPIRHCTLASYNPRTPLPSVHPSKSKTCLPWKPYNPLIAGRGFGGVEQGEENSINGEASGGGFWHRLVFEVSERLFWYGNLDIADTDLVVTAIIWECPAEQSTERRPLVYGLEDLGRFWRWGFWKEGDGAGVSLGTGGRGRVAGLCRPARVGMGKAEGAGAADGAFVSEGGGRRGRGDGVGR